MNWVSCGTPDRFFDYFCVGNLLGTRVLQLRRFIVVRQLNYNLNSEFNHLFRIDYIIPLKWVEHRPSKLQWLICQINLIHIDYRSNSIKTIYNRWPKPNHHIDSLILFFTLLILYLIEMAKILHLNNIIFNQFTLNHKAYTLYLLLLVQVVIDSEDLFTTTTNPESLAPNLRVPLSSQRNHVGFVFIKNNRTGS